VPPTDQDVRAMAEALSAVCPGLERTRRQTTGANLLGLLQVIADHDGIRPAAIAQHREMHPSLVVRRLRECEEAGFVTVAPDPADRRSLLVTLDEAGTDELRRLTESSIRRFSRFVDDWEPDEVRRLTELLEKLRASMAAGSGRGRRQRAPRASRRAAEPDWLIDFLGH
jgi:DNA-binding MarR family transcriptional regulator